MAAGLPYRIGGSERAASRSFFFCACVLDGVDCPVLLERELFCPGTRGGVSAFKSLRGRCGLMLTGAAGRAWDATRGRGLEGVLHLSCWLCTVATCDRSATSDHAGEMELACDEGCVAGVC